jgi:TonB family protein
MPRATAAILVLSLALPPAASAACGPDRHAGDFDLQVARAAAPTYPRVAIMARFTGDVPVSVVVRDDGAVASAEPVKAGFPQADRAAVAAAKRWRFQPPPPRARREVVLHVCFQLADAGSSEIGAVFEPPDSVTLTGEAPYIGPPIP